MNPARFLLWVLGIAFTLGLADSFASLTFKMGEAAISAHQHGQISYSSYTNLLWKKSRSGQKQ